MNYRTCLFIGTLSYTTTGGFGFLISSQLTINPLSASSIQAVKQTVDIELEDINTTEYIPFVTPPSIFDFNLFPTTTKKRKAEIGDGSSIQQNTALPRVQDVPFHSDMVPIPHKNLISKSDFIAASSVSNSVENRPEYSRALKKAKQFADQYLSKEEQLELRRLANRAKRNGASDEEVRQVISRYLNSVLTPDEKRIIASQLQRLNEEFSDDIFGQD